MYYLWVFELVFTRRVCSPRIQVHMHAIVETMILFDMRQQGRNTNTNNSSNNW